MKDTFNNDLNIGDNVVYMYQYYDGRWDSFHKGTIVGFTNCFVKIKVMEEDKNKHWAKQLVHINYINGECEYIYKPYILRQPHKIIKL